MPGFKSVTQIISETAKELGLVSAAIADPFASTNANIVQLMAMMNPTARELMKLHPWSHLVRQGTFNTAAATESYALATVAPDFGRIVDQTEWNRTQQMPAPNGVSSKQWQQLKAVSATGVDKVLRIQQEKFFVHPVPTAIEAIYFEYVSRYWGAADFAKEEPTAAADVIQFDPHLFTRTLKRRWKEEKGFATQSVIDDFTEALELAKGGDGAAPTLGVTPAASQKYVDSENAPETGFGS